MLDINHILVVLDHDHAEHIALDKALWLASTVQADLTLMTSVFEPHCDDATSLEQETRNLIHDSSINKATEWLEQLAQDAVSAGLTVHKQVCWDKHLYDAIMGVMNQNDFDLVIKGTHQHHLVDRIFTHTDWNMIRHCPAPVMLVKSAMPWQHNRVLASIDATSMDASHQRINDNILAFAEHLSDHFETDLHLVNAYPDVDVAFAMVPEINAPDDVQKHISAQHHEACNTLASRYSIQPNHIHIMEGDTTDIVPDIATAIEADLVVAGTVGRDGLAGVIVGNTAEELVDKVACDIVVLKPSDGIDINADAE